MTSKLHGVDLSGVQRSLRTLSKRHFSIAGWMKLCENDPDVVVSAGSYTTSLKGLLLYLLHGLAPLLTIFCSKLDIHQQRSRESRGSSSELFNPKCFSALNDLGESITVSIHVCMFKSTVKRVLHVYNKFFAVVQDFQRKWNVFREPMHTEALSVCLKNIESMIRSGVPSKEYALFVRVRLLLCHSGSSTLLVLYIRELTWVLE